MTASMTKDLSISEQLADLSRQASGDSVNLGWILDQLNERAFGLFLLILALPCCIPFLYGVPQIVALPLVFVSGQIVLGKRVPWLPERLRRRPVKTTSLAELSRRAAPILKRIEAVSVPRLAILTRPPLDRLVGIALLLFSASILTPLPATNTVPGIAVLLVSMGLLQRDGILVGFGCLVGAAWIAALLLAGATLATLLRGWIGI